MPSYRPQDPSGVGGVGHDVEALFLHPPDDDVVKHRTLLIEQMGVLRPARSDLGQVVGEGPLQDSFGVGPHDADGTEVADVEYGRLPPAGHMLGQGARAELEGHLPATETDQARPVVPVPPVERAAPQGCRTVSEQPGPGPCARRGKPSTRWWGHW